MTPAQTAIVVARTIEGVPGCKIAQGIGLHESSVSRERQKPDVKAKVEAGISRLINRGLTPSVNTLCRFAAYGNTKAITNDLDLAKLSLDASKVILNHVSGSGPQTIINQLIYSQSTHATVDNLSMEMLNRALGLTNPPGIIDIVPVDNPVDSKLST